MSSTNAWSASQQLPEYVTPTTYLSQQHAYQYPPPVAQNYPPQQHSPPESNEVMYWKNEHYQAQIEIGELRRDCDKLYYERDKYAQLLRKEENARDTYVRKATSRIHERTNVEKQAMQSTIKTLYKQLDEVQARLLTRSNLEKEGSQPETIVLHKQLEEARAKMSTMVDVTVVSRLESTILGLRAELELEKIKCESAKQSEASALADLLVYQAQSQMPIDTLELSSNSDRIALVTEHQRASQVQIDADASQSKAKADMAELAAEHQRVLQLRAEETNLLIKKCRLLSIMNNELEAELALLKRPMVDLQHHNHVVNGDLFEFGRVTESFENNVVFPVIHPEARVEEVVAAPEVEEVAAVDTQQPIVELEVSRPIRYSLRKRKAVDNTIAMPAPKRKTRASNRH